MKENKKIISKKKILLIIVSLQVILIGAAVFLFKKNGGAGGGSSSGSLVPIWVAVFIPIIATRKKKPSNKEGKNLMFSVYIGLALCLLLGIVFFFLKKSSI
ncbi:hypothetical protein ACFL1M_00190 [Patescibacteria group bacterium]